MTTQTTASNAEAEIRAVIEARTRSIHHKDVDALVAAVAPEIVLYDALDSLQRNGQEGVREKTGQWLGWYAGPVGFEVRDLTVAANDDLGFAHYLYHITGTMTNGNEVDMWLRSTLCLRKTDGAWKIVHEHASVPFDAESGDALATLTP